MIEQIARRIRPVPRDERGASAVEYAFLASLIAVVIIAAVTTLGIEVNGLFERAATIFP